jgi:cytoskeletal protein CcmA (bactofilin family)
MFSQQKEREDGQNVETVVGPSLKVKGNFQGKGNIIVEGEVEGSLKTDSFVYIGNKAKVTANVEAKTAKIGGIITGNLKIYEHVDIIGSAQIYGDIQCASLSVEKGAKINGKCIMENSSSADAKSSFTEKSKNKE